MTDDPTSLDHLRDLALPPAVPWWPPAPGWYVVIAALLATAACLAFRYWKRWQAQAYRRSALAALASADDPAAIAKVLRRTALAIAPRASIAGMSGDTWLDWLAAQSPRALTDEVRQQLGSGVYARSSASPSDLAALRDYADGWIRTHQSPPA